MFASLAVAAWCFVAVARDRFLDRSHLILLGALEVLILVMTVVVAVRLAGGEHPVELTTFVGYLLTTVLLVPAAVGLALMEPTKWGSVIAGSSALIVAVLTLRLLQVWTPLAS